MTSPLDQKLRINGPVVITGNRVADGAVVYRRADGGWATKLREAAVVTSAAAAQQMLTAAAGDEIRTVGAYAAPVQIAADGEVRPGNLRELIRCGGPTVERQPVPRLRSSHDVGRARLRISQSNGAAGVLTGASECTSMTSSTGC